MVALIPALRGRGRQSPEFKASPVNTVSARTVRATEKNSVSKKKKKERKEKKKIIKGIKCLLTFQTVQQ
jgi:hypothetical protein